MLKKWIYFLLFSLLFTLTGCNYAKKYYHTLFNFSENENNKERNGGVEEVSMPEEVPVIVTAMRVKRGELVRRIKTEGVVVCRDVFDVKVRVSGKITGGIFTDGREVRRGEEVVSIDDRKYKLDVLEAESKLNRAIATFAVEEESLKGVGKEEREFVEKLNLLERDYKMGKIDFNTYIERGFQLRRNAAKRGVIRDSVVLERTGISQARYSLEKAKINLEYCHIRAPFDGIIANCKAFKGKEVQVGEHLMDILNKNSLRVKASILEDDLRFLRVGKGVEVRFEAFPGKVYRGVVDEINPVIDEKTRTASAFIKIKGAKNIYVGLYAEICIDTERIRNKFIVPNSAVLTREGKKLIFLVDKTNHAKWVYVKVVGKNDLYSAIENTSDYTGINEGDLVIISNNLTLGHGSLVEVKRIIE